MARWKGRAGQGTQMLILRINTASTRERHVRNKQTCGMLRHVLRKGTTIAMHTKVDARLWGGEMLNELDACITNSRVTKTYIMNVTMLQTNANTERRGAGQAPLPDSGSKGNTAE